MTARDAKPGQKYRWFTYVLVCERQARSTTFFRVVRGALANTRVQLKHSADLEAL